MKVTLEKNYKEYYTIKEYEMAKTVIECMKEDTSTVADYAKYAVYEALRDEKDYLERIIEAKAETTKNCRINNAYGETGNMDVWVTATAKTNDGFIEIGAYLTDIFSSGGDYSYKGKMYICNFKKV